MIIRHCQREGVNITLINIVRRLEQVDDLRQINAENILNSSSDDFEKEFKEKIQQFKPSIILEAIGSDNVGKWLDLLPPNSTCIQYGLLSEQPVSGLHPVNFIYKSQRVEGFMIQNYLQKLGKIKAAHLVAKAAQFMKNDFVTEVSNSYGLDEFKEAVTWQQANQSKGKVLFKPSLIKLEIPADELDQKETETQEKADEEKKEEEKKE